MRIKFLYFALFLEKIYTQLRRAAVATSKYDDSESKLCDVSLDSDETHLEDPDVSASFDDTDVIFSTDFCDSVDEHRSYPGHQEIPISSAVTIRYTVSMSKSSITYKKSEGYSGRIRRII